MHNRPSLSTLLRRAVAAAALLGFASTARAQSALGLGEDATTPAGGTLRTRISQEWTRYDRTFFGGDTTYLSNFRIRDARLDLELGLADRLSVGAVLPIVATKAITTRSSLHDGAAVADSVLTSDHSGLGDVAVHAKLVWLRPFADARARTQPSGVHVRSAISGVVSFGTAVPDDPRDFFDLPTGETTRTIEGRSETDLLFGSSFWMSLVGRYSHALSEQVLVRVTPENDAFSTVFDPIEATRQRGNILELEATPRLGLGRYFSIGAQYRYLRKQSDRFTGTADTMLNGAPVHLDAAVLDTGTAYTEHRVTMGVVYSTEAAYMNGHARWPLEISYEHSEVVSISGGRPKSNRDFVMLRWYTRLWGADPRVRRGR